MSLTKEELTFFTSEERQIFNSCQKYDKLLRDENWPDPTTNIYVVAIRTLVNGIVRRETQLKIAVEAVKDIKLLNGAVGNFPNTIKEVIIKALADIEAVK